MKWLKFTSSSKLAALLVSAAVLGLASQSASALTAAGTTISNTATINYTIGGVNQTPILSTPTGNTSGGIAGGTATSFLVDNKVSFTLTSNGQVNVNPGQLASSGTAMSFTLNNQGNAPQSFNLSPAIVAGSTFTPTGFSVYVLPGSGVAAPATWPSSAVPITANTVSVSGVAANTQQTVFIVPNIPLLNTAGTANVVNGNLSLATLTATAVTATGAGVVNTAAGAATSGVVDTALNVTPNGSAAAVGTVGTVGYVPAYTQAAGTAATNFLVAYNTYKAQSAAIYVAKTQTTLCDLVNGSVNPLNIPGAAIRWQVTIYNPTTDINGNPVTTNAMLTTTTDNVAATLPLTFDTNLIQGVGTALPGGNAATTCALATGTPTFATGTGVGYATGTAASLAIAQAVAAPSTAIPVPATNITVANNGTATGTLSINAAAILPAGLPPGSYLNLYFNSFVQ